MAEKRPRGRPRKNPVSDAPKRPAGRPRKNREKTQAQKELSPKEETKIVPFRPTNELGQFVSHGEIATDEEMDAHNLQVLQSGAIYSKDMDSAVKINSIIGNTLTELEKAKEVCLDPGKKIRFEDTELVARTAERYLMSCQRTGVIPSKSGLAVALGCTSRGLNKFMAEHKDHRTAQYLEMLYESFANIYAQAALSGAAKEVFSIFMLKSAYNFRDNAPIVEPKDSPLGTAEDTDSIARKYDDIVVDDDDD